VVTVISTTLAAKALHFITDCIYVFCKILITVIISLYNHNLKLPTDA